MVQLVQQWLFPDGKAKIDVHVTRLNVSAGLSILKQALMPVKERLSSRIGERSSVTRKASKQAKRGVSLLPCHLKRPESAAQI